MGIGGALASGVGKIAGGLNRGPLGGIAPAGEADTQAVVDHRVAAFVRHECALCGPVAVPDGLTGTEQAIAALALREDHYARVLEAAQL